MFHMGCQPFSVSKTATDISVTVQVSPTPQHPFLTAGLVVLMDARGLWCVVFWCEPGRECISPEWHPSSFTVMKLGYLLHYHGEGSVLNVVVPHVVVNVVPHNNNALLHWMHYITWVRDSLPPVILPSVFYFWLKGPQRAEVGLSAAA